MFSIWFKYPELPLLLLIACVCSLHLVWNALPVCPMYFNGQSKHFIRYMALFIFIYLQVLFYYVLCCVCVVNAIFIVLSLKRFVIHSVSFPVCVKVAHFFVWCYGSMFSFCSCVVGWSPDSVHIVFIVV